MLGFEYDSISSTKNKLNDLLTFEYDSIPHNLKWDYNLAMSSYLMHIGIYNNSYDHYADSVNLYYKRALKHEPRKDATAVILYIGYKGHKRARSSNIFSVSENYHYFLDNLPHFNADSFIRVWSIIRPFGATEDSKPDPILSDTSVSPILLKVFSFDQNIRKKKPKEMHSIEVVDSMNRMIVDTFYSNNRDLKLLSNNERYIISLVLHHSANWEWNKKWFINFFSQSTKGSLIGIATKRHLLPSNSLFKNEPDFYEYLHTLIKSFPDAARNYGFKEYLNQNHKINENHD